MNGALGGVAVVANGLGFPLTQVAIARFGRPGAALVEAVTVGILVRDLALVARGTGRHLDPGPAVLLYAETATAAIATLANAALLSPSGIDAARGRWAQAGSRELVRRVAVGALFGIRSMRLRPSAEPVHHPATTGGMNP